MYEFNAIKLVSAVKVVNRYAKSFKLLRRSKKSLELFSSLQNRGCKAFVMLLPRWLIKRKVTFVLSNENINTPGG